ncbi:MAG: DUF4860 domain-containing protein [Clostridia bacterium]|nr:DUF4860 domain-containing protein [Clostridia bacterium]
MRERNARQHHIDSLFALLVFALFASCILLVLLTGADLYRGLVARDDAAYSYRTGAGYLASRVRQAENPGLVSVEPFGDGEALMLTEPYGERRYITVIYCHEGWLCELFTESGGAWDPAAGERVMRAESLELSLAKGLLTIRLYGASEGEAGAVSPPVELSLWLRGEGEER